MSSAHAAPRSRLASRIAGLRPSIYARLLKRLEAFPGETFPFHIGESHILPDVVVQQALKEAARDPSMHRYAHPQGAEELRAAIVASLKTRGHGDVDPAHVVVTHGATHGLNLACQALLDPGDVMLVLSPHWPLINAMVHTASAVPVEVPFTCKMRLEGKRPGEILSESHHLRTRAIYVTTPNNPDGVVLTDDELAEIAAFAVSRDLYVIVDEAYDAFHFGPRPRSLSSFPGMSERTVSVFTLSKSHRMTGLRVGYTKGPPDVIDAMVKLANISIYNVSLIAQQAALAALNAGDALVDETVRAAHEASIVLSDRVQALDGARLRPPDGGAYVFADLTEILRGRDVAALLDKCVDGGVVFAPGAGFGPSYKSHVRLCYTAMPMEKLARGADRFAEIASDFARAG